MGCIFESPQLAFFQRLAAFLFLGNHVFCEPKNVGVIREVIKDTRKNVAKCSTYEISRKNPGKGVFIKTGKSNMTTDMTLKIFFEYPVVFLLSQRSPHAPTWAATKGKPDAVGMHFDADVEDFDELAVVEDFTDRDWVLLAVETDAADGKFTQSVSKFHGFF